MLPIHLKQMAVRELIKVVDVVRTCVVVPKASRNLPAPGGAPVGMLKPG